MNTRLLRRVAKHILAEPLRHDMRKWVITNEYELQNKMPPCGTVACICGWGAALTTKKFGVELRDYLFENDALQVGVNLFKLDYNRAESLFYAGAWPEPFRHREKTLKKGGLAYAKNTAAYIEFFIKTRGAAQE